MIDPPAGSPIDGFGQPHASNVAEDDPAITIARPQLRTGVPAYAAMPKSVVPTSPGIVVTQAIWGVDAQLRDVVRRYAKRGYVTIAPALFARFDPPDGDGLTDFTPFRPIMQQMFQAKTQLGDLLAAKAWIRSRAPKGKVGVTGFCMGGGIAITAVIGTRDYDAAAIFYGSVRPDPNAGDPFDWTRQVTTPMLGSFAALDTGITPDDVRTAWARLPVDKDVVIYEGAQHGFFNHLREGYHAAAAADAWTRVQAWFAKYLTAPDRDLR